MCTFLRVTSQLSKALVLQVAPFIEAIFITSIIPGTMICLSRLEAQAVRPTQIPTVCRMTSWVPR